jgi:homoserine kinase
MFFSVVAPASSANLGPGFDCLAIALDRWTRVDARLTGDGGGVVDAGSPDLLGGANLVISAMEKAADILGLALPDCEIRVTSDIPIARGLGSSAAAIVAGVRLAGHLAGAGDLPDRTVINIAGAMEGHADNVSASTLGGVTVATPTADGFVAEVLIPWLPWSPVLFVPDLAAFTSDARAVLPTSVPVHDAIANVSRSALLGIAFRDHREDLLALAMEDRLHQPYRATIFSHLQPVIAAGLAAGALGASLSGAGPTVLAFARPGEEETVGLAMAAAAHASGVHGEHVTIRMVDRGCYAL